MRDSPLPESLSTFHAAVLPHATPVCALNAATAPAKRVWSVVPASTSAEIRFRAAQFVSPHRSNIPKRSSGAHSNPIGRSPRPSQTPATYFKRPYRNCPRRTDRAQYSCVCRGSPDRDLTFLGTDLRYSLVLSRHPCQCGSNSTKATNEDLFLVEGVVPVRLPLLRAALAKSKRPRSTTRLRSVPVELWPEQLRPAHVSVTIRAYFQL